MKQFLLATLFIIAFANSAFAQPDRGRGGISIPRASNPTTAPKPSPTPSNYKSPFTIDPFKKEFKSDLQVGGEKKPATVVQQQNNFVTGGSEYEKRTTIKPEGESAEAYKGHLDFGEIRTKSPYIVMMAYDSGAEDGDRIKVTLNGKILFSDVTLTNYGQGLMVNLNEGFNDLKIEALNQGYSGPNTGSFTIYDNKDVKLKTSDWNLSTGFHGRFLIVKE